MRLVPGAPAVGLPLRRGGSGQAAGLSPDPLTCHWTSPLPAEGSDCTRTSGSRPRCGEGGRAHSSRTGSRKSIRRLRRGEMKIRDPRSSTAGLCAPDARREHRPAPRATWAATSTPTVLRHSCPSGGFRQRPVGASNEVLLPLPAREVCEAGCGARTPAAQQKKHEHPSPGGPLRPSGSLAATRQHLPVPECTQEAVDGVD